MPQRSLDQLYSAQPPPAPATRRQPRSLDELYGSSMAGGATTETPHGGIIDSIKNMSGRDWAATGTRLATGWLSGIPSMVPGVGTLIGGAIGAGGEGLAQLIGGEDFSLGGMGVAGGLGMVPMGKVFGAAGQLAKGAGVLEKTAALAKNTIGNSAKGALLNAGAGAAHRYSETGELPGKDYSLRETIVPAAIGAGGGALTSIIANRSLGKLGAAGRAGEGTGGGQGAFDFEGAGVPPPGAGGAAQVSPATLQRARAAMRDPETTAAFERLWGQQQAPPVSSRPQPAPSRLEPGSRSMSLQDYAAQLEPQGAGLRAPGRGINQPLRETAPVDDFDPTALTPGSPSETLQDYIAGLNAGAEPSLPGTNPRGLTSDPPTQPSPARAVDDWFFGRGNRPSSIAPEQPVIEGMPPWQGGAAAPELAPAGGPTSAPPRQPAPMRPWEVVDNLLQGKPLPPDDFGFQPQPGLGEMGVVRPGDAQPVLPDASGVPKPIRDLYDRLKPRWDAALQAQAGDDIPFTVDQNESLEEFAARLMSDDPRMLMNEERKVRAAVESMGPAEGQQVAPMAAPAAELARPAAPSVAEAPARGQFKPITTARQRAQSIIQDFVERAKAGPVPEGDDVDLLAQGIERENQARAFAVEELQKEFPLKDSFKRLPADLQGELRRIYDEMVSFPFTKRTFNEPEPGMGGTMNVVAGAGGSPIYHDIMGGRSGSRKSVINALAGFIEGGKKPTAVVKRAYEVALRTMAGDQSLRPRLLPPDAGFSLGGGGGEAGFTNPDLLMSLGGGITGAAVGPWVDEDHPLRGTLLGAGAGALAGIGGAKFLNGDFDRVATTTRPRPAPRSDRFDIGGGDAGFLSPDLAFPLGGAAAGAALGPIVDKDSADPAVSTIGGAGTGALLGLLARSPQLVERMRSSGLFSGAAIPKSALGNAGAMAAYAAEHPESAADIVREFFSPETMAAAKGAWKKGLSREATSAEAQSIFSYPGRMIGAPDAATRDVLERVASKESGALPGVTSPAAQKTAGGYTLSGDPQSRVGQLALEATENPWVRLLAPVVRTPVNWMERGLERVPGVGGREDIRAWSGSSPELARRRQVLGAVAALGGVGAGIAGAEGGPLEDWNEYTPFAAAAAGPFGLPFTLGKVGTDTAMAGGNNSALAALNNLWKRGIVENLPLPTGYDSSATSLLRSFIPYAGAQRAFSPIAPRDFETSSSYFGPALAQIPGLNELLFPLKRNAPGPAR